MVETSELSEQWLVKRLMRIADASVGDLIEVDSEGIPQWNWNRLTEDMRKTLNDVEIHEYQEGRGDGASKVKKVKVRSQDQLRAMEMLMKILGLDKKQVHISGDEHLIERLHAARARATAELDDTEEE